ncbi:uncharacterized protein LOC131301890 isoform X2 [Rhododendron vialii]|uniref:uncharacterized protein LOC131301890 isoform X2 n=1 Tax=Rhododendron vialii TaxID=182163 RepID=UPI0026604016|nr:uncharacterized protein LOC131301890 isoform X2 [Rhododendron vialii]
MPTTATPHHHRAGKISMSGSSTAAANCRWENVTHGDMQRRNAMENFTAMVMKFAASDPTRPLTDARRALIEKRLLEELPHFRTPNHPPYSAMIHGAIGELKEPDGCTEESISKFIRRHYDDLPWSHSTLLNHHLQKLCECGEIVVTSDNCYLLSDGITNLESCSTPGRELIQGMQKRQGKKQSGRAGCCRMDETKEITQQGELMEVIYGQFQLHECHNLVIEDQNLAEEPHTETIEEPYVLQAREQEQQIALIGDYNQLEGKTMESEHLEVNQREVLGPERPPSLDVEIVKELSEFQQQQLPEESLHICSQQKTPKRKLDTMTTSNNLCINSNQVLTEQQYEHRPLGLAADLRLVEQKQQPDFSNSERPLEHAQEKACKSFDGLELLKSGEKLPGMQQLQGKQRVRKKHAKSRPEVVMIEDVPTNSNQHFEIPKAEKFLGSKLATVVPSLEEQDPRTKLCVRQKASKSEQPPIAVSLNSPKEPDGKRKRTRSKSKTRGTEDVSMRSEQIAELPNLEQCHGPETRPVEPCTKEEVQRVKRRKRSKEPQYILALEAVKAARQPDVSVPEQSSHQTKKRGSQLQDRGRKMSSSTPPMTSKTELFSSAGVQYQETGLPNQESSPKPKQMPVEESTQTIEQQANLRGHEKMIKSHPMRKPSEQLKQHERQQQVIGQKSLPLSKPKTRRRSLDSRLASHTEPEQPPVSQNSERAKETHYQLAPENSQNWRFWPQQAKSEAATTAAEVALVQDQNEPQQQQLDSQDGGRPLEQKFDMAQDVVQPSQSYPQDQHEQKPPAPRGRGRPLKCLHDPQQQEKQTKGRGQGRHHKRKPDDATMQNQVPEPKRRGRGRPRKPDK